jgi:hypothetical protein
MKTIVDDIECGLLRIQLPQEFRRIVDGPMFS